LSRARLLWNRLRAAVPASLAMLLVVVAVFGVAWALIVPPWQAPDTPSHFAYVESIAARHALPGVDGRPGFSRDQTAADNAVGAGRIAFDAAEARPSWDPAADRAYRAAAGSLPRSDGGGPNAAAVNPPLYYLYAAIAYDAMIGGDEFDRLYAIQLWGVLLLLAAVIAAWLLAGEVLGPRQLPTLITAAVVGLLPMQTFICTSVTVDALLIPLWTFALWLGARVITRAARRRDAIALCAVTAAAILTKATSYALVPAVLLALVLGWRHRDAEERRALRATVGPALAALVLPVLLWVGSATALGRSAINTVEPAPGTHPKAFMPTQFLSYLWQFYFPRPPFLKPFRTTADLPLWDVWIGEGWGAFGWLDVRMVGWIYTVLATITGAVAILGATILVRMRTRLQAELIAFFALALAALLLGLHVTEYRSIIADSGPVIQGRYALPLVALFGLAVGLIVSRVPLRARGAVSAVIVAALLVLQVLALATVARAYYT
jgi:4-amino-4-deoxy-L-arabinose transferase-like glycosyltransferase